MPRHLRTRAQLTTSSNLLPSSMSGRSRRAVSSATKPEESATIIVARESSTSPADAKKSIRLHFKMPASKLRDAISTKGRAAAASSRESIEPVEALRPARSTRAKRAVVIDSGSEDEDEDEEEEQDEDEDENEEEEDDDDEDEDAEGEEDDALVEEEEQEAEDEGEEDAEGESDVDMQDAPPPPVVRQVNALPKPTVTVTPAPVAGKARSMETKEMQLAASATSDEELSELDSDDEGNDGEGGEEDAEGEEEDEDETMGMGDDDDGDEDEAEGESDEQGTPDSRESTPDIAKMTKRQRSRLDQVMGNDFLQLPMEPQIKKHLTAEEHAMRRAEMARRRKNLSEKRNEEEKMDTINRLLKKQAPKRRGKISAAEIAAGTDTPDATMMEDRPMADKADPVFSRWISRKEGVVLGLPIEWKDGPLGAWAGREGWKAVEEVEG